MSSAAAGGTEENDQMLALEQRLLGQGFGELPTLLRGAEDFPFDGDSVAAIVTEALRYLQHQYAVDLVGARVLAALGEAAVKAQALDAISDLLGRTAAEADDGP